MINHTIHAVRCRFTYRMIHEVAGEFAGGTPALFQTPDNAPAVTSRINFQNADIILRRKNDIAEVFTAAGGDEIFACEVFSLYAHVHPFFRLTEIRLQLIYFFFSQTIGQVAAVAFVPALEPAVFTY